MVCAICKTRRARRPCPGVRGEICSLCCGTEREVTVDCPLDCEFLIEARRHERPAELEAEKIPNRDIRVTDQFLSEKQELVTFLAHSLAEAGLGARAVDPDIRSALDGLVRTYRTLQSGLQYQSVPDYPVAAVVFRHVQQRLDEVRRREAEGGVMRTRDVDVLGALVFLQRLELSRSNGRPKGRAFLGGLAGLYGEGFESASSVGPAAPSLIIP